MAKIADLWIKLGLKNRDFKRGIDDAEKKTSKFGNSMKKIGGLIAGAFAVERIVSFGKELIKLGGEAEGVRAAFERIGGGRYLQDMKDATAGTVSELELMKRAVTASNLGLPIENLASLFEFATKRAQETGESVDYLVNSIVTGIGRKSPLILDNLGISAVQLREKLKGVGLQTASTAEIAAAVGEIAADSMRESGEVIKTAATRMQELNAAWDDFKMGLAESENVQRTANEFLEEMNRQVRLLPDGLETAAKALRFVFGDRMKKYYDPDKTYDFTSKQEENIEKFKKFYEQFMSFYQGGSSGIAEATKNVSERIIELNKLIAEQQSLITKDAEYTSVIEASKRVKELQDELKLLNGLFPGARTATPDKMGGQAGTPQIGGDSPVPGLETEKLRAWADENSKILAEVDQNWEMFVQDMAYLIEDFGVEVVDEFGKAMGEMMKTGQFPSNFGDNVIAILGKFISSIGKMLISLGTAALGFQELLASAFSNPASAIAAIAAGTALVLLGGAIGSAVKSGPTGGGGSSTANGFSTQTVNNQDQQLVARVSGRDLEFVLAKQGKYTDRT